MVLQYFFYTFFTVWYGNCPVGHNMLEKTCKDAGIEGHLHNPKPACDNSNPGTVEGNTRKTCNEAYWACRYYNKI